MEPSVRDYFGTTNAATNQGQSQELLAQTHKSLGLLGKTTLDIAVTGVSGSGKSSLVNAIRGLDDDDAKAAKTDVVEGTREPERYTHPSLPNVTIWDLPGIGTEDFQAAKYLKQVHFEKYDLFIIVSCTRFTENDTKLAQDIQKRKKKFYFVRSKIDVDLENEGRKKDFREEKTLEKIRKDCYQNLEQPRVFFISRWDLDKYDFPLLQMALEEELNLCEKTTLDIAITGEAGAGKSSLVNAMRGLEDDDDNASKTDVVQGTFHPESFPHPFLPKVTIWDLPGIGTEDFRAAKYLKQVHFAKYDTFFIVSSNRFTENHIQLAREIHTKKKKFYFVRSKIDVDLRNEGRKKGFREEETLERMRSDCDQQLEQSRVFLISRWDLGKYDFPLLQMALEKELGDLKGPILITAMPPFSKEVLEMRKKDMRKVVWMQALLSCALGQIPVPGLSFPCDVTILVETLRFLCRAFGLDKASLGRAAKRVGKNEAVLRSAIKTSPLAHEITPQFVVGLLQKSSVCGALMELEVALDCVPVVGCISGGGLSFATTFHMLWGFLNDVVGDAENVLAKASERG